MSRRVSRGAIISAILRKDLLEYSRDKVWLILTVVGLVIFVAFFYLAPDTVDETITLGMYQKDLGGIVDEFREGADAEESLDFVEFTTEAELEAAIAGDVEVWRTDGGNVTIVDRGAGDERPDGAERVQVGVGIAFADDFAAKTAMGEKTTVTVYADAAVPPEIQGAIGSLVREIAYGLAGDELPVVEPDEETILLGTDRAGDQVSIREKLRPMLAFFVLMIETFSLAALISTEVAHKTITAVLVTPAKLSDVLTAKTIYGTLLALVQAVILLLLVGAFTLQNWWLLMLTMLLGAIMFTGIAMIIGAAGRDFIGTLFYGILFIVPLTIPAFSVLFPGTAATWVQVLPTYGIIQSLNLVTTYQAGFSDVAFYLGIATVWLVVIYVGGLLTLKRKVESL